MIVVKGDGEARGAFEDDSAVPLLLVAGCAVAVALTPVGVGCGVEAVEFALATDMGAGEGLVLAAFAGG